MASTDTIVVFYTRYWLPESIHNAGEHPDKRLIRIYEFVLEPMVFWICLLRKVSGIDVVLAPIVYDEYLGGSVPAALVNDRRCYKCTPLRQEKLLQYLLDQAKIKLEAEGKQLPLELRHCRNINDACSPGGNGATSFCGSTELIALFINKNLRVAILYLLWVHPPIAKNVTKQLVLCSSPKPWAYITFNKVQRKNRQICLAHGYTSFSFVMGELKRMLQELINGVTTSDPPQKAGTNWLPGTIFGSLAVLFSIPCRDVEPLLEIHNEFGELKRLVAGVAGGLSLENLNSPFMCGDTFNACSFSPHVDGE